MRSLLTPWRYDYLLADKTGGGCVFCRALEADDDGESLVVHRGVHNFALLNRYPYANGHLMVVPNEHVSRPSESSAEARAELFDVAAACELMLSRVYNADGINLGMNIGRAAGAGITGHYHMHVVPRWEGDTNFMAVTSDTRLIPEALGDSCRRIRAALRDLFGAPGDPARG